MGSGAAALAPLWVDPALKANPHLRSARSFFMRRRATWGPFARQRTSIFDPESPQAPLGSPRCPKWPHGAPREPKGSQSDAKESPLGAQGAPKAPKRGRKVAPGNKMRSQSQAKETNKTQNYIHINKIHANSRSTAIQRPTSIDKYRLI